MRREPLWRRYTRFFGANVDADISDELEFHVAMRERDLRARGYAAPEARVEAMRRFGDMAGIRRQLQRHDARRLVRKRRVEFLGGLMQDLRYGVRSLRSHPGFAVAVLLTLGLGIGASTAMFSAVDAVLLRPLPFHDADRLVELPSVNIPFDAGRQEQGVQFIGFSDVEAMREQFSGVAGYAAGGLNLSDPEHPVRVRVGVVTAEFFGVLGVAAAQGRGFSAEEGRPGGPAVVVLSHALWQRQFGGAPLVGSTVPLNGRPYEVIGIMPPGFSFPELADLWIPLSVPMTFATFEPFRGWLPSTLIARLADGTSVEAANSRMLAAWEARVAAAAGDSATRSSMSVALEGLRADGAAVPLQSTLAGSRRQALVILLGATGLLLLIACVNVTNLLLSRAAVRRREIALRSVLGATRGRVVRQLLTESLLLALGGAACGLLLAPLTLGLVRALIPESMAGLAPPRLDWRVLGFALGVASLAGFGFGLWPALGVSRTDPGETMKQGGHGATAGRQRARRVLVSAELALATMLLVGAGLMLRSFSALLNTDPGFNPERVALLELTFPRGGLRSGSGSDASAQRLQFIREVTGRLAAIPGIEAAGVINDAPVRGSGAGGIAIMVQPEGGGGESRTFGRLLQASAGYFETLRIPLRRGRYFTDTEPASLRSAVVSEELARKLWPAEDALGRRFIFMDSAWTVVGVVADVREGRLENDPLPMMYFPAQALTPGNLAVVARGTMASAALLNHLQEAVRVVAPSQAVFNVRTMEDAVSSAVAPRRTNTILITAFGALALLLAALGVYAVTAYGVAQRLREFGIRSALGASRGDIVSLVTREVMVVAVAGIVLGLSGAWALARTVAGMLYGVEPRDPAVFAAAAVALLIPVAVAALVPARRAGRMNPMEVIRSD